MKGIVLTGAPGTRLNLVTKGVKFYYVPENVIADFQSSLCIKISLNDSLIFVLR